MRTLCASLIALVIVSCSGPASDLSVVSKTLRRDVNASTAGAIGDVPSTSAIFWVEGKVQNSGTEDVKNVTMTFRVTDGRTTHVILAVVPEIQAGKTVDFKSPAEGSILELRLVKEEPAISVGR
jgi:hypothetical protein